MLFVCLVGCCRSLVKVDLRNFLSLLNPGWLSWEKFAHQQGTKLQGFGKYIV